MVRPKNIREPAGAVETRTMTTVEVPTLAVLQIEEDSNDMLLLQHAITEAALDVTLHSVPDGEAAITYLKGATPYHDRKKHPMPDLILSDLKMRGKDGLEMVQWLRQQPELKFIPVIILTSSGSEQDMRRAYEKGVNSYLIRPVNFKEFTHLIEMVYGYWLQLNRRPIG